MKKIAVLISGRGSNLKSLIDNAKNYRIIAVLSDKEDAPGLKYAKKAKIPQFTFSKKEYGHKKEQKKAIFETLQNLKPDYIALAGFMQIVPLYYLEEFTIINIHPSLLPAYPGLDTHRRVLEAGEKEHGCTVHFVDAGIDTGPIIAQEKVVVLPSDTEESLANRVLEKEHQIYPWVFNNISNSLL